MIYYYVYYGLALSPMENINEGEDYGESRFCRPCGWSKVVERYNNGM